METLIYFGIFVILTAIGYLSGSRIEQRHYRTIEQQEKVLISLPAVTSKNIEDPANIESSQLVIGSVVLSVDYFKRFLASLRSLIGGSVSAYETLLDRGRREALIRMKNSAKNWGADCVINTRFTTSRIGVIGAENDSTGCFEILAYGTAIKLKTSSVQITSQT
jgi:uncharacterized protein YbjQ (UPF0145 family)